MKLLDLYNADCLEILKQGPSDSIDALITDPPAGISFMGKEWDDDKGGRDQWISWMTDVMKECFRVMKPGAHGLVWALPRTSHWTATALENAGFEVRDVVTHLFGTGFPKSLNVGLAIDKANGAPNRGKATHAVSGSLAPRETIDRSHEGVTYTPATDDAKKWAGFGTALKPAAEFWVLIRKPLAKGNTVAANVLQYGTGGLNIDASRIGAVGGTKRGEQGERIADSKQGFRANSIIESLNQGRFPANLVLDEEAAAMLDSSAVASPGTEKGPSRFFYVAKASKTDKGAGNTHPTVKSTALMEYLIRLITPPGGTVLDPFMGSGSTGVAAQRLGFGFIGVEQNPEYFVIAQLRLGKKEAYENQAS
jgi:site-specific DNA-methyltransferase (adenine-specific)